MASYTTKAARAVRYQPTRVARIEPAPADLGGACRGGINAFAAGDDRRTSARTGYQHQALHDAGAVLPGAHDVGPGGPVRAARARGRL